MTAWIITAHVHSLCWYDQEHKAYVGGDQYETEMYIASSLESAMAALKERAEEYFLELRTFYDIDARGLSVGVHYVLKPIKLDSAFESDGDWIYLNPDLEAMNIEEGEEDYEQKLDLLYGYKPCISVLQ